MPNIFYFTDDKGRLCANWPGVSKRIPVEQPDGTIKNLPRKVDQFRLGLVVDKDHNIFFREDEGFYQFNPEDKTKKELPIQDLPNWSFEMGLRRIRPPVCVDFGGSYFLEQLIKGIQYDKVIGSISYLNTDRLYAMLHYYILCGKAAYLADDWYANNFTKFLYPKADPKSQRISEFLDKLGSDENRRDFLMAHIPYILKSTNEELCVLVDSTGVPNKCDIPFTRINVHEGEVNIEWRLIVVVQKSTGLPVYYDVVPGSIPDVALIQEVYQKLKNMGYKVEYSIGDAAFSCPAVLERLVLSGIDFMTQLNPTYDTYKSVIEKHLADLEPKGKTIRFHNRDVKILKTTAVVATDRETGKDIVGYVYLCKDYNSWHGKSTHLYKSKMTVEESKAECDCFGLFALISTIELPEEEVLKEYYMRQTVEQFFDYIQNDAALSPARTHLATTTKGHVLLSFIATFITVLIKNRLNILDSPYARIPLTLMDEPEEEEELLVDNGDGTDKELLIEQEPLDTIFKGSPSVMFFELQFQRAEVFNREIVPGAPTAQAREFYKAYRLVTPLTIHWDPDTKEIDYEFREHEENKCTRKLAFASRPTKTNEEILQAREKRDKQKVIELTEELGLHLENKEESDIGKTVDTDSVAQEPKRGRGRPPGSKNKKTLAREAELAKLQEGEQSQKRGRGRPPGSKNKKTLAREAELAKLQEGEQPQKRGRGRPPGSKNKKTLEREAELAKLQNENAQKKRGRGRPLGSKNKKTLEQEAGHPGLQ